MEPELIVLEEVWKTLSALFASLTETHSKSENQTNMLYGLILRFYQQKLHYLGLCYQS
jgi:hypothetical protein